MIGVVVCTEAIGGIPACSRSVHVGRSRSGNDGGEIATMCSGDAILRV